MHRNPELDEACIGDPSHQHHSHDDDPAEDLDRLDVLAGAACECECPDCDSMPDHPRHDETPPTPDRIERARRSVREVSGSPWWAAATLEAAYLAAVRERDDARAAIDENREAYREQMEVVVRERDELRENFTNAAGAVAYAVDRLPPSGSKMTQAAERRMREAVYLMDAALIPAGAALHREDGGGSKP